MSYRAILEVLKLASPGDVVRGCSTVSSQWRHAAESQELWVEFCRDGGIPPTDHSMISFRESRLHKRLAAIRRGELVVITITPPSAEIFEISSEMNIEDCSMCFLSYGKILCVAGKESDTVTEFDVFEGTCTVQVKTRMNHPRTAPGLLKHGDLAYVFGGDETNSVERYNVTSDRWTPVTSNFSHPIRHISPCVRRDLVYLVRRTWVQTFCFTTETCATLELRLPQFHSPDLACIRGRNLLILRANEMITVNLRSLRQSVEKTNFRTLRKGKHWSSMTPVWENHRLYFTCCEKARLQWALYTVNFRSAAVEQVIEFFLVVEFLSNRVESRFVV